MYIPVLRSCKAKTSSVPPASPIQLSLRLTSSTTALLRNHLHDYHMILYTPSQHCHAYLFSSLMKTTGSNMPFDPRMSMPLSCRCSLDSGGLNPSLPASHTVTRAVINSLAPSQCRLLPARDKCLYVKSITVTDFSILIYVLRGLDKY